MDSQLTRRNFLMAGAAAAFSATQPHAVLGQVARQNYRTGSLPSYLRVIPQLIPDVLERPLSSIVVSSNDMSGTVDARETNWQVDGVVEWLYSDSLASQLSCTGPMGFATAQYGSYADQAAGFGILTNGDDAKIMADAIFRYGRRQSGSTNLNDGIRYPSRSIIGSVAKAFHCVGPKNLYVMGDGLNNASAPAPWQDLETLPPVDSIKTSDIVRACGEEYGVTVNAIALNLATQINFEREVITPEGIISREGRPVPAGSAWLAQSSEDVRFILEAGPQCFIGFDLHDVVPSVADRSFG